MSSDTTITDIESKWYVFCCQKWNTCIYTKDIGSVSNFQIGSRSDQLKIWTRPDPIRIWKNLSRNPVIRSQRSFLLDRARRPRHNKKKIAEIGPVNREKIAKNDFFTLDQSQLRRIMDRSVRNTTHTWSDKFAICNGGVSNDIPYYHIVPIGLRSQE